MGILPKIGSKESNSPYNEVGYMGIKKRVGSAIWGLKNE
jgi:hypothetical protein